jgi:hypothetical protein
VLVPMIKHDIFRRRGVRTGVGAIGMLAFDWEE